jgi:APA family basic amino acid/polyamine antiporter
VSIFGSLAAVMMSAPRVYFAMSRDGLFFKRFAEIHPRFGTPARAIVLQAMVASLLVGLGTFNQIIAYFIFITVLFIALTVAAVFILRRRDDQNRRLFLTVGYPLTPIIFLVLIAILLILLAASNPKQAFLGVLVVGVGLPVYWFINRERSKTEN